LYQTYDCEPCDAGLASAHYLALVPAQVAVLLLYSGAIRVEELLNLRAYSATDVGSSYDELEER
jgi:hypothetical protein